MTIQTSQRVYLQFQDVSRPIMAGVQLLGKRRIDMQRYAQDTSHSVVVMPSSDVNTIAYTLREARSDNYSSLAAQQLLVKAGKVPVDAMRQTIGTFDAEIWQNCWMFLGEISDCIPEKRNPSFKLPRGKNLALYREWVVNPDGTVNVAGVDPIYLKNPTSMGLINSEWINITGLREGTRHYPADLGYSRKNLDGLNALGLDFRVRARPGLFSGRRLVYTDPVRGAVLGSRMSADEIVEGFVQAEPQRPQRSAYESGLAALGSHLDDLRKHYDPRTIQAMEKTIANLKELGPQ